MDCEQFIYSLFTVYIRLWYCKASIFQHLILQVALEQPRGVKANLHQAFISGVISTSMYTDEDAGPNFRKLVYNLCLFNSVILERKKYGSLGWNIPYEFTNSDLEVWY